MRKIPVLGAGVLLLIPTFAQQPAAMVGPVEIAPLRVTIHTTVRVEYRAGKLREPDRIYLDFNSAKPRPGSPAVQPAAVSGPVKQVRMALLKPGVTRVVLDLDAPTEFTVTRLSGPERIVVELRGAAVPVKPKPEVAKAIPAPPPVAPPEPPQAPLPALRPERKLIVREPVVAPPSPLPTIAEVATAPRAAIVEQIIAKVNNEIITYSELARTRRLMEEELKRQQAPPERIEEVVRQNEPNFLRDRIDQLLLVQKAKELEIKVDQEVSQYLAGLQRDSKITDPDQFQKFVAEQSGMPFEDFKLQTRDGLLTREVIRREVGGRIIVSKAEARKYYDEHQSEFVRQEQVLLREIFLSTVGKDDAAVEKKAQELAARARKNENFATLARDHSDAESAKNSGELPPFKRGDLRAEIEAIVFAQPKGAIAGPLHQSNGYLILRIEERTQAGLQPFEMVEYEVMDKLYRPRMDPAVRAYLTKLRREAFLEIRAGYTDSAAAPGKDTSWKDPARLIPATVTKDEVIARLGRKKLLWLIPVPGSKPKPKER